MLTGVDWFVMKSTVSIYHHSWKCYCET